MVTRTVVVDGSNIATEGRSIPSLAQLDEAVRAYMSEDPEAEVIVVVDASFGYRIDEVERVMFDEAEDAGEIVSPPAGAVGRGDGFLLRIADRVDATVLSNDSFQEFHGDYKWLFDEGRLVGGKPVPGVGWIFTPRTPVRGPRSRMAVRDAKKGSGEAGGGRGRRSKPVSEPVVEAIAEATAEVMGPPESEPAADASDETKGRGRRRGRSRPTPGTVNEPLPFITFIAEHHLGTEVEGLVEEFTSHGAFVVAGGARCYVPLVGLGSPPPRSAKEVLTRGEVRSFVVQALDAPRRGIELALPGLARVAGAPTDETVEAEIVVGVPSPSLTPVPARAELAPPPERVTRTAGKRTATKSVEPSAPEQKGATPRAAKKVAAKKGAAKKGAAKKVAAKKVAAKKAPVKKSAVQKANTTKAPAKKAPANKPVAKTTSAKRAAPVKKGALAQKVPAKKKSPPR